MSQNPGPYAHSASDANGEPLSQDQWEPLFTPTCVTLKGWGHRDACQACIDLDRHHGHLNKVAYLAGEFASEIFPADSDEAKAAWEWGYLAGLWHDLGKYSLAFQQRLKGATHSVDHATIGAQYVAKLIPDLGHTLSYGIAGHHSGLLDAQSNGACQKARLLKDDLPPLDSVPDELLDRIAPHLPAVISRSVKESGNPAFSLSQFSRHLYSCLIDADFLATEAFMNPNQAKWRNEPPKAVLKKISGLLDIKIASFGTPASGDKVNLQRSKVVRDCEVAAEQKPGLFTLTVPTGGGKTLSSLKFGVEHAINHGQNRIIYVVPFTSIIEQNADVIREIVKPLQTDNFTPLIEHHSALSPEKDTPQSRLAIENWDAPIIITTAVQFYESLFAAKTSRSRKVHNIANSVVILDEAQTLPVNYLAPCLKVLQELAETFHTTCVLCTATQPAIGQSEEFPIGLNGVTEIISDPKSLFSALDRVEIKSRGPLSDRDLSLELGSIEQCLCIVNRRLHAQEIYQLLGESDENFHLSALMCPEHRSEVLAEVRSRLDGGLPTRVVSTQLIEAGVDVDFPVVYRSMAGLDSIAQAAGRCNRNGKLTDRGITHIFEAENQDAEAYFRATAQVASQVINMHDDLLGNQAIHQYFDLYYYQAESKWDENQILDCFEIRQSNKTLPLHFQFKTAADNFKLINDNQIPVIIPFDSTAKALIKTFRNESIPLHRELLRRLQRYSVNIRPHLFEKNRSAFESVRDNEFHILISPELNYSKTIGLILDEEHACEQILIC